MRNKKVLFRKSTHLFISNKVRLTGMFLIDKGRLTEFEILGLKSNAPSAKTSYFFFLICSGYKCLKYMAKALCRMQEPERE